MLNICYAHSIKLDLDTIMLDVLILFCIKLTLMILPIRDSLSLCNPECVGDTLVSFWADTSESIERLQSSSEYITAW
jgi:hypothetical protein